MTYRQARRVAPVNARGAAGLETLDDFLSASPRVTLPLQDEFLTAVTQDSIGDVLQDLQDLGDRRLWHPAPAVDPIRTLTSRAARLRLSTPSPAVVRRFRARSDPLLGISFRDPSRVLVCIRRKARRESIFASGQAGRPGRRTKPRRNPNSGISCRR